MALPVLVYVFFAVFLYVLGVFGLAMKRHIIKQIIAIEILINAAHLNFIAFSTNIELGSIDPFAQSVVVVSIGVGAAVIALALLLTVQVYRVYGTLDTGKLKRLRR